MKNNNMTKVGIWINYLLGIGTAAFFLSNGNFNASAYILGLTGLNLFFIAALNK